MAVQSVQPELTTQLWEQVREAVKHRLGSPQAFDTWFLPIVPKQISPQNVELEVPNPFFVDWIYQHPLGILSQCLAEILGQRPEIRLSAREARPEDDARDRARSATLPGAPTVAAASSNGMDSQLHPPPRFEGFALRGSDRFTHAACLAVAQNPGNVYNPLFIFGGSGLGKTHLLHAIGHSVRECNPNARVCYVPAERFTNEMIYSIQHAQTLAFRNKYRNVDLLLIDDIQFLAGKESTQEEFFYTFNHLRDAHRQVVVTADKPPKDIPMLEERLTSRFNQGLVADIKQPDLETSTAIL